MIASTSFRSRLVHVGCVTALLLAGSARAGSGGESTASEPRSRALLRELCSAPRLAGTCGSPWSAQLTARWLEEAGWQVEIDSREVLLSLPRRIELALYPNSWSKTAMSERIERFDPDAIPPGDIPKCNAWSASGSIRAAVIDAGFGTRADFERLKTIGLDPRGAIALVRYGKCYRGIKVDLAEEHGCVGVLLFSEGDGPEKGDTWPKGPWKPDWDAQRGSILPIAKIPGDPTTPGWPSPAPGDPNAKRIGRAEVDASLPKIPCVPIGSREAQSILAQLAKVETKDKDGNARAEPLGPGPLQVRLVVDQPRDLRVVHNVIARLPGASEKTVIAGGHRDSWVRGANDNGSGTVVLVRAAQELGKKARAGWKPAHTITIGLWDAEEYGLIGSTEWAEANAPWLREHAIVYVNMDASVGGTRFGGASGSPGMLGALRGVLEKIPAAVRAEGDSPANLWEEWKAAQKDGAVPSLGLPGSGSDFAVFVHHLNVPMLDIGFTGSRGGGYHTSFDDFSLVDRHIDPGFVGHELAARTMAELLSALSEQGETSFSTAEAAIALAREARSTAATLATSTDLSPAETLDTDSSADYVVSGFERLAVALDALAAKWGGRADRNGGGFYAANQLELGLAGRPWFKNPFWCPGLEDGYGSETFPTLRAALSAGDRTLQSRTFQQEVSRLVAGLEALEGPQAEQGARPVPSHD